MLTAWQEARDMAHKTKRNSGVQQHSRRWLLQAGASAAALWLAGCGGGSSDGGDGGDGDGGTDPDGGGNPPPTGTDPQPSGWLVYSNSGEAAAYDFATQHHTPFDPGSGPSVNPGMSAAPGRLAIAAQEGDNDGFGFAAFDLAANRKTTYLLERRLSFQTSAVLINGTGNRAALSVNELTSATNDERVDRILLLDWPAAALVATIDGYEEPVWDRSSGELLAREPKSGRLRLFGPALEDRGWLADLVAAPSIGAYDVSPDGRYVVYDDIVRLRGYDRHTGESWVVADRISSLREPCFSPDGKHLAMHAIDLETATTTFYVYIPHIVPFEPLATVTVDSKLHGLSGPLAETTGRMGWVA
jgi:hypothetical protein